MTSVLEKKVLLGRTFSCAIRLMVLQKKSLTACGSTPGEGKRQALQQATKHTPPHSFKCIAKRK
jgi:hypothetical protein